MSQGSCKQDFLIQCMKAGNFKRVAHSTYVFLKLDVNIIDEEKCPVLNYAVKTQQEDFVKFFLSKGANPNLKDKKGNTPLILAFQNGNKNIINLLLKANADMDLINNDKETPFDVCHKVLKEDKIWLKMIGDIYNV